MSDDSKAVAFVASRREVDVEREKYERLFVNLQQFVWRSDALVRPSPATLQLVLLSNYNDPALEADFRLTVPGKTAKRLIKQAAETLGEEWRGSEVRDQTLGNRLQRAFTRTYRVFEALAVLSLACLKKGSPPLTHRRCESVLDKIINDRDLAIELGRVETELKKFDTVAQLDVVAFRAASTAASKLANKLLELALEPSVKREPPSTRGSSASDDETQQQQQQQLGEEEF